MGWWRWAWPERTAPGRGGAGGQPLLRRLQLELVNACNYRCPLCRTLERDGVTRRRMTLDELRRVVEPVARDLSAVALYGTRGEPYLHADLEPAIAWLRAATPARVELSTNGSLLLPDRAQATLEAGLDRLIVAVDGLTQESYARYRVGGQLETVLENVRELCRRKRAGGFETQVVFQLIPMAANEPELPRLDALARELGVDEVRLKLSQSVARDPDLRPRQEGLRAALAAPAREFPCPFGSDKLYVDPNGDVFPCCYAEGRPGLRIGNALETPLPDLFASPLARAVREPFLRGGERHPFCQETCAARGPREKLKLPRALPRA